jgi:integrase
MMSDQTRAGDATGARVPWNKGRLTGQKRPFTLRQIWEIRIRLQIAGRIRDLALFNLGIDSKLRGCDLMRLRVGDVAHGGQVLSRTKVVQQKTGRPVSFELTAETRDAVQAWIRVAQLSAGEFLFFSQSHRDRHLTTRQYARIVDGWVRMIGADPSEYGTHSLRRSKATLIYRQTKNLRAVQLLLGHTKLESTLRYLGVEVDDALEIAEHTEI